MCSILRAQTENKCQAMSKAGILFLNQIARSPWQHTDHPNSEMQYGVLSVTIGINVKFLEFFEKLARKTEAVLSSLATAGQMFH